MMIYGTIEGIKNSILDRLEKIYGLKMPQSSICSYELIKVISEITTYLKREICVSINRKGKVVGVSVGDSSTVEVASVSSNFEKLSKVRIIHTHPNGNSKLSELDISVLLRLKLDCIAAVGVQYGEVAAIDIGFCSICNGNFTEEILEKLSVEEALNYNIFNKINYVENFIKEDYSTERNSERAILVGIDSMSSLKELEELSRTCNLIVLDKIFQKRISEDSAFYIGKGKIKELAFLAQIKGADLIIFDDELSGCQIGNIEDMVGIKIIDRTTLILDIFATRARSREAKIQVELAQLKYRLTRISEFGRSFSRTGGGIGTRGPGEKKLETDRRHIRDRIYDMTCQLKKITKVRKVQRQRRRGIPKVSIVGYTNSGKSTLRNSLCEISSLKANRRKDKVFEADMLFATLDTTTRALELKDGRKFTLTDTVGFVKKLPHELVEAFKSTLEEVLYSDLLLHVVDVSSEDVFNHIDTVDLVLEQLGAKDKAVLLVLNKIDREVNGNIDKIMGKYNDREIICISAKKKINLDLLINRISQLIGGDMFETEFFIPYSEQKAVAFLHKRSKVEEEDYRYDGVYIRAAVDKETYNRCKKFVVSLLT